MATIVAYKDIGIANEPSLGASVAVADYIHVKTYAVDDVPNKERVDDTSNTTKGHDRIEARRVDLTGSLTGYGSPRVLHHAFELVNMVGATAIATVGTSASEYEYQQTTGGSSQLSKSTYADYNNSTAIHRGMRASQIELSASNDLIDVSLDLLGVNKDPGITLAGSGEATKPWKFSNVNIYIGATLGDIETGGTAFHITEWTITYANNLEGTHQSGQNTIKRSDIKIPTFDMNLTLYNETEFFQGAKNGCSTYAMRLVGELDPCQGTIVGSTPYKLTIDVPFFEVVTSPRTYEAGEFISEKVAMYAKYSAADDALWIPRLIREN